MEEHESKESAVAEVHDNSEVREYHGHTIQEENVNVRVEVDDIDAEGTTAIEKLKQKIKDRLKHYEDLEKKDSEKKV